MSDTPKQVPQQPNPRQQLTFPLDPQTIAILKQVLGSGTSPIYGRIYKNGSQSISDPVTPAQITFDTANFTSGITFDSVNHQFIIETAGKYLVHLSITTGAAVASKNYTIYLYKNAGEVSQASFQSVGSGSMTWLLTDIVDCAAGDGLVAYLTDDYTGFTNISNNSATTFFAVAKL
jgi:hypothetical protein